jgi:Rod binding domain-containing protein
MRPVGPAMPDVLGDPSGLRSGRDPKEVATQFEALLLKNLVEAMRATTGEPEASGGQLVDHLIDDALAGHLARSGGVGLAAFVEPQASEPQPLSASRQLELERWLRHEGQLVTAPENEKANKIEVGDP